jgi:hypothetical protein
LSNNGKLTGELDGEPPGVSRRVVLNMSNPSPDTVVLELAPLPREQVGPFLLLGVPKTADQATVERHWAERLKLARWQQVAVPLADINWAREILSDRDKRIQADTASLNLDTVDQMLQELTNRLATDSPMGVYGQALDVECDLTKYAPAVEMPDAEAIRANITVGEVPEELPAARHILEKFLREPLDPWNLPVAW